MSFFKQFAKFLAGGDMLRPIDYLILTTILMFVFTRFWG